MSIPVATTTIAVYPSTTATGDVDPYDAPEADPAAPASASGVRAVISAGGSGRIATAQIGGGEDEVVEFTLVCDPAPITYLDHVEDETTGVRYEVTWAIETAGVAGLAHTRAGLRTVKGRAA